jgi:GNAT superfamily N-acetyltransferase
MDSYSLHYEHDNSDVAELASPAHAGEDHGVMPLAVSLRDQDGCKIGGLMGSTRGGWLMLHMLWVPDTARHQGYGRRLLALAEMEARRRGCRHAFVERCRDDQLSFYERCGYEAQPSLPGFSAITDARALSKTLD